MEGKRYDVPLVKLEDLKFLQGKQIEFDSIAGMLTARA
jgi:hypothetical protein